MKRGRRVDPWFPLFIDKWLWGSARHELIVHNDADGSVKDLRGIYMDLLALSKKDDGFIRANPTTAYPHEQLAGMFRVPVEDLRQTIEICLREDVQKLTEPSPGIYFIASTRDYSISPRHQRRLNRGKIEMSAEADMMSGNGDVMSQEERKGNERKGNEKETKYKRKADIEVVTDEHGVPTDIRVNDQTQIEIWKRAFPAVVLDVEIARMVAYLRSHPEKRYKNWRRFMTSWLGRSQDYGGTRGVTPRSEFVVGAQRKKKTEKDIEFEKYRATIFEEMTKRVDAGKITRDAANEEMEKRLTEWQRTWDKEHPF